MYVYGLTRNRNKEEKRMSELYDAIYNNGVPRETVTAIDDMRGTGMARGEAE